jgi:hypothetical protein
VASSRRARGDRERAGVTGRGTVRALLWWRGSAAWVAVQSLRLFRPDATVPDAAAAMIADEGDAGDVGMREVNHSDVCRGRMQVTYAGDACWGRMQVTYAGDVCWGRMLATDAGDV